MKQIAVSLLALVLALCLIGCGKQPVEIVQTVDGNMNTYHEMSDGTWRCNGYTYQYRLEITGRLPGATADSTYVYLSNIDEIPFQKAAMAGGLSSNTKDYFSFEEAVLVELGAEGSQENRKTALRMPKTVVITDCYDGEALVIKPKGTDAILYQVGEEDASVLTLAECQIQYLNEAYEAITGFSESPDQTSTSTVTIKTEQGTYSFGLDCAADPLLNKYIDDLLALEGET